MLVVGADSAIGGRVLARAREAGLQAWGTSRRGGAELALDLAHAGGFVPPVEADCAVLCAGITSIAACCADYEATARVNVTGMEQMARRLRGQGAHVLFLSTNMVFDGRTPYPTEDAAPNPASAYGRQKAEAEERLLALGCAVLRLTKVAWPGLALLKGWREDLSRGRAITPHAGRPLAPVHMDLTVRAIGELARRRAEGVFHLSAARDLTYGELARAVAAQVAAPDELVREVPPPAPCEPGAYPDHTVLAMDRLARLLGIDAPHPLAVLS